MNCFAILLLFVAATYAQKNQPHRLGNILCPDKESVLDMLAQQEYKLNILNPQIRELRAEVQKMPQEIKTIETRISSEIKQRVENFTSQLEEDGKGESSDNQTLSDQKQACLNGIGDSLKNIQKVWTISECYDEGSSTQLAFEVTELNQEVTAAIKMIQQYQSQVGSLLKCPDSVGPARYYLMSLPNFQDDLKKIKQAADTNSLVQCAEIIKRYTLDKMEHLQLIRLSCLA